MARYTGPQRKYQRRFNLLPDSVPQANKRQSDFSKRLEEKQKLRFIYGLLEKQFRRYYDEALAMEGNTKEYLVRSLETRLDNVVYRLGFAKTRQHARQLVSHGHVLVDNKKVDIPSYHVLKGQTVTLKPKSLELPDVKTSLDESESLETPKWLAKKGPVGKIDELPTLDDVQLEVDVSLIIEYYSR